MIGNQNNILDRFDDGSTTRLGIRHRNAGSEHDIWAGRYHANIRFFDSYNSSTDGYDNQLATNNTKTLTREARALLAMTIRADEREKQANTYIRVPYIVYSNHGLSSDAPFPSPPICTCTCTCAAPPANTRPPLFRLRIHIQIRAKNYL